MARIAVCVAALLAGCVSGSEESQVPDGGAPGGWVGFACEGDTADPFAAVELNRPIDYVGFFSSFRARPREAQTIAGITIGQRCGDATDVERCEEAVATLSAPGAACVEAGRCGSFFISSQRDEVMRSDERADLVELLAPIDTPEKAVLIASYDGTIPGSASCSLDAEGNRLGLSTRLADHAFVVRHRWNSFEHGPQCTYVRITSDGTLALAPARPLPAPGPTCEP